MSEILYERTMPQGHVVRIRRLTQDGTAPMRAVIEIDRRAGSPRAAGSRGHPPALMAVEGESETDVVPRCSRSSKTTRLSRGFSRSAASANVPVTAPLNPRRLMLGAAKKLLLDSPAPPTPAPAPPARFEPPRLTAKILEKTPMSRSRDRILANLDEMYREAFERSKATGDAAQMASLDFAYRREQLYSRSCSTSATRSSASRVRATARRSAPACG